MSFTPLWHKVAAVTLLVTATGWAQPLRPAPLPDPEVETFVRREVARLDPLADAAFIAKTIAALDPPGSTPNPAELAVQVHRLVMRHKVKRRAIQGARGPADQGWRAEGASPQGGAAIPGSERQALLDLFNATGGPSWTNNTGWGGPAGSECTWYGVTCNADGSTVLELRLFFNRLTGSLPASLGNLAHLQHLSLDGNFLDGPLPPQLGQLAELRDLILYGNHLTGAIPSQLGELTSLRFLDLENNEFTGPIPPQLGSLLNLQYLDLSKNQLAGPIPPELGNLSQLTFLALHENQLSGPIPPQLGNLGQLVSLSLNENQLQGSIPAALGSLSLLRSLLLHLNQLSGPIPAQLGNLSNLRDLSLGRNQLTGPLPPELGNLAQLEYLHLHSNRLGDALPAELGNLSQLRQLWLQSNAFVGEIPASFLNLTKLFLRRSNFRYNALHSGNPALVAFLNSRQETNDWQSTQTVPPTGVAAVPGPGNTRATVTWTPVTYQFDPGAYHVLCATTPGGPYTLFGTTASKSDTTLELSGLAPHTTYYVVVATRTDPHWSNENTVLSSPSAEVSVTTLPALQIAPPTLPAASEGVGYSQTLSVTGGAPPYSWSVVAGALPPGLSLHPSAGTLAGTPAATGTFLFTVRAVDDLGSQGEREYTLSVTQRQAIPLFSGAGLGLFVLLLAAAAVALLRR